MKLMLITLAFDSEIGGFSEDPLAAVESETLSVLEHFFHHAGLSHLVLIVQHRPARERGSTEQRSQAERYGTDLLAILGERPAAPVVAGASAP